MNNTAVLADQQHLESLFAAAAAQQTGSQVQNYLTQHLCVRLCGFVEQSVRSICYDYAIRRGQNNLASFVSQIIEHHYYNFNAETLGQLMGRFNSDWKVDLDTFLTPEHRYALGSVRSNRINISHGWPAPTLGLVQLRRWYNKIVEVLEYLETTLCH